MTRRLFCVNCKYFLKNGQNVIWCIHPDKDNCNHCELYWPVEGEVDNGNENTCN